MTTFRSLLLGLALAACGAAHAETRTPTAREEAPPPVAEPEPEVAVAEPVEPEPPPPPPEPEPVVIEPGVALGPIRIGMSEEEVLALHLERGEPAWDSSVFGPYRVFFDDEGVERVEAFIGDLERIQVGDDVFEAGTHIHELRDAWEDCVWYEGGGERYRCADGTLFVHTTHTLDPARYTVAVERP